MDNKQQSHDFTSTLITLQEKMILYTISVASLKMSQALGKNIFLAET